MKKIIKSLQLCHIALWVVTALYAGLSEAEILPNNYVTPNPETTYMLNLISIITTIGGGFLALRLFAGFSVRRSLQEAEEKQAFQLFKKWTLLRCGLLAVGMWPNVVIYYAASYDMTAAYCLLLSLIFSLFCWPSQQAFEQLRSQNKA